jgi:hypothetical protein
VARVHEEGRDVEVDYTADGAQVRAVVGEQLAAELNGVALEGFDDPTPENDPV